MPGTRSSAAYRLGCAWAGILLVAIVSWGCAAQPANRAVDMVALFADARAAGLQIEDPIAVDAQMKASMDKAVKRSFRVEERYRLLRDYLRTRLGFSYSANRTLTARAAWRERRGDCMAFTNLFIGLARYLDIDAYFVHVREVSDYYERGGAFFVSSHVAVGQGSGSEATVLDVSREHSVWREMSDWKLAAYRAIRDGEAFALYYNNVAVDEMLAGRSDDAERMFRFWLAREPDVAELHNNLGVLLARRGRYAEALVLLQRAIAAFPSFKPLYTNAIHAAQGAGRPDVAADLARRGARVQRDDPFFLVARALNLFRGEAYAEAAVALERARAIMPDSVVIVAWLARAYLLAGQRAEGVAAYQEVRRLAPDGRLLRDLEAQFPELR